MRLFSRTVPGGAAALITFLISFSYSSPTGLYQRDGNETSEIICFWERPQSALYLDTIFVDGGYQARRVPGENGNSDDDTDGTKLLYSINLTHPFSMDDDWNKIMQTEKKGSGVMGQDFVDGFMLANEYEFIVYGGFLDFVERDPAFVKTWSIARYMRQNGATPLENPGDFSIFGLKDNINRYIAAGASVNVPSENKAFVFSGVTSPTWGELYLPWTVDSNNADLKASGNSSRLISIDMSVMRSEKWTNDTLPSDITPRKSAELVWLPVGEQGMLVALGGALNWAGKALYTDPVEEQRVKGREFVENVHLYDIANDKWYTQKTSGEIPPPTSEFCAVAASSKDNKTHQIYAYGGWPDMTNGRQDAPVSANIYVLSLPSFKWIKVYSGTGSDRARRGHRCHKVADNKMMVIGGRPEVNGRLCVNSVVQLFNLNTLQWEEKYDPAIYDEYKVPAAVREVIGGNEEGGADATADEWNDDEIPGLFTREYSKTVNNHWPYPSVVQIPPSSTVFTSNPSATGESGGSGMPSYVPPLLGAILGLLGLITVLCAILFWLRRKKLQKKRLQSDSAASTVRRNRQTWSWLLGVYGDEKNRDHFEDPTPSTETANPFDHHSALVSPMTEVSTNPMDAAVETQGREVYEMPDSSLPQELHSSPINTKRVTIDEVVTEMGRDPIPRPE